MNNSPVAVSLRSVQSPGGFVRTVAALLLLSSIASITLAVVATVGYPEHQPPSLQLRTLLGLLVDGLNLVLVALLACLLAIWPRPVASPHSPAGVSTRLPWIVGGLALASLALTALAYRLWGSTAAQPVLFTFTLGCALWLALRLAPPDCRVWLSRVLLLAVACRLLAVLVLHWVGLTRSIGHGPRARGLVLDDESVYHLSARAMLEWGGNLSTPVPRTDEIIQGPLVAVLSGLYWLLGPDPLLARLLMAFLGVFTVLLYAFGAHRLFGKRAGLAVGIVLALSPGLVLWSSTLLKEAFVMALVALALISAHTIRERQHWTLVSLQIGAVASLAGLREYAGLTLAAVLVGAGVLTIASHLAPRSRLHASLAVSGVVIAGAVALGPAVLRALHPHALVYRQTVADLVPPPHHLLDTLGESVRPIGGLVGGPIVAVTLDDAGTQVAGMVIGQGDDLVVIATGREASHVVSPRQVQPLPKMAIDMALRQIVAGFGDGLKDVLVSPWQRPNMGSAWIVITADHLVWLATCCAALLALRVQRHRALVVSLVFSLLVLTMLAFVPGNPGNLVRQRSSMSLAPLTFAASPLLGLLLGKFLQVPLISTLSLRLNAILMVVTPKRRPSHAK